MDIDIDELTTMQKKYYQRGVDDTKEIMIVGIMAYMEQYNKLTEQQGDVFGNRFVQNALSDILKVIKEIK